MLTVPLNSHNIAHTNAPGVARLPLSLQPHNNARVYASHPTAQWCLSPGLAQSSPRRSTPWNVCDQTLFSYLALATPAIRSPQRKPTKAASGAAARAATDAPAARGRAGSVNGAMGPEESTHANGAGGVAVGEGKRARKRRRKQRWKEALRDAKRAAEASSVCAPPRHVRGLGLLKCSVHRRPSWLEPMSSGGSVGRSLARAQSELQVLHALACGFAPPPREPDLGTAPMCPPCVILVWPGHASLSGERRAHAAACERA